MSFPLAPAQRQENPRAASSSCVCGSPSSLPPLGLWFFPSARARNEKLVCCSPYSSVSLCRQQPQGKRGSVVPPQSAQLYSWHQSASSRDVATSWQRVLRVWPLVLKCPRCSGWDRALGGRGSLSARLVLVIAVRGGKLFLDLLHGWWALPGWRRHGKQEGPLSRVFLKALPYF